MAYEDAQGPGETGADVQRRRRGPGADRGGGLMPARVATRHAEPGHRPDHLDPQLRGGAGQPGGMGTVRSRRQGRQRRRVPGGFRQPGQRHRLSGRRKYARSSGAFSPPRASTTTSSRVPGRTRANVKILDQPNKRITDINLPGLPFSPEDLASLKTVIGRAGGGSRLVRAVAAALPAGTPGHRLRRDGRRSARAGQTGRAGHQRSRLRPRGPGASLCDQAEPGGAGGTGGAQASR